MNELLAGVGALRERTFSQVPADELFDDSRPAVPDLLRRHLERLPEFVLNGDCALGSFTRRCSHGPTITAGMPVTQHCMCSVVSSGGQAHVVNCTGKLPPCERHCTVSIQAVGFNLSQETTKLRRSLESRGGASDNRTSGVTAVESTIPGQTVPTYCECGCGEVAPLAKRTRPYLGQVKGQPLRFINGHHGASRPRWLVKDCGYHTPCRLWQRHLTKDGYGERRVAGRQRPTHVVEWEAVHGPVPDGLQLDHLCRQRACGEPTHLEPVPQIVNLQRGLVAKLNPEAVLAIRASDLPSDQLAKRFGVAIRTITSIRTGERWANVGGNIVRRPKGMPRGRTGGVQ